jgi:hypothetical protein
MRSMNHHAAQIPSRKSSPPLTCQQTAGRNDTEVISVVGPAFRTVQLQVTASQTEQLEKSAGGTLSAGLPALFPWLKCDASATATRKRSRGRQEDQAIVLEPIETAARQLVKLSLHYLVNQSDRICAVAQGAELPGDAAISASPRMIAFIDVPPGAMLLPQAAELNDGRVVTFFDPLVGKLQQEGDDPLLTIRLALQPRRERPGAMPTGSGTPTAGTSTRQSRSSKRASTPEADPDGLTTG